MIRHPALVVLFLAACTDAPEPPQATPSSVPMTTESPQVDSKDAPVTPTATTDIALGGSSDATAPKKPLSKAPKPSAGGAADPAQEVTPSSKAMAADSPKSSSPSEPPTVQDSPAGAQPTEDAATAALRARTRESKWSDFRSIVQRQADLMVKAGLARKKARQEPTPENLAAYDSIWGGIAPLAQKVTEYMAQSRFSEEDRAVMSMIVDEIQTKAMAQVQAAP
jgi:hypothetical protein